MEKYIIDRFEGEFAVLEKEDGGTIDVPKTQIPDAKEGDVVGKVVVSYDGDIVAISDIVIAETVEREFIIYALSVIRSFLTWTVPNLILPTRSAL